MEVLVQLMVLVHSTRARTHHSSGPRTADCPLMARGVGGGGAWRGQWVGVSYAGRARHGGGGGRSDAVAAAVVTRMAVLVTMRGSVLLAIGMRAGSRRVAGQIGFCGAPTGVHIPGKRFSDGHVDGRRNDTGKLRLELAGRPRRQVQAWGTRQLNHAVR